jgi:UDP-N-acetylglucosamine:LPS N-acetylglucosamine transferase
MKNKRIYVLYAPGGNGHKSAAQTILETMKRRHPSCETLIEDAYGFGAPFLRFSLRIYDSLLKLDPSYVKYGYWLLSAMNTDESLTARFPETVRAMANRLRELQPSLIVSVHSAINAFVVAALKQAGLFGKIPFVIVCTDLTGNFLRSWVHPQADLMVSFLDEGKQQMQQFGIPNRKIAVLGGPIVNPRFSDAQRTQQEARAELGLDPHKRTLLLMSGGVGIRSLLSLTDQVVSSGLPLQAIICCGRNQRLQNEIERRVQRSTVPCRVLGFTDQVPLLMDAADVMVSKPGPGVISEALVKELPLLLDATCAVMPQEQGNIDYVVESGIGKRIDSLASFRRQLRALVEGSRELDTMRWNLKRMRKTESAQHLARLLMHIAQGGISPNLQRLPQVDLAG